MQDSTQGKPLYLGLDLGQQSDHSALVALEAEAVATGETKDHRTASEYSYNPLTGAMSGTPRTIRQAVTKKHYRARWLERLPLGTPYPQQVRHVKALMERLKGKGYAVRLVCDRTGVGVAVADMLKEAGLQPINISIHGGDEVKRDGRNYGVPKRDLVGVVQVLLQTERLKIDATLPEAAILTGELQAFKVNINTRGHDSYGNDQGAWRENAHDDMVLALAVAAWYGENEVPPPRRSAGVHSFSTL